MNQTTDNINKNVNLNSNNGSSNENIFQKKTTLSFEVFPPKKDDDFPQAFKVLDSLSELKPDFISVTYGAGGSRSGKTVDIASYIQNNLNIPAIAHMTCVGSTSASVLDFYSKLKEANVNHVLALRGDRPNYMTEEEYSSREFTYASDLIPFLKENTNLHICGACYPEKHYEAFSMESDLRNLKRKQDLGAEYFITQLFFDNDLFYGFMDRATAKGITIPISAGIMPITNASQLGTTVKLSGSSIPKAFTDLIAKYGDNAEDMRKAGIDYAIRQIIDLKQNGARHIHLYSMNKPVTTAEIVNAI